MRYKRLVFVALVLGLSWAGYAAYGDAAVKRLVEEAGSRATGARVTVDRADFSLPAFSLVLTNLRVVDPRPGGEELLSAVENRASVSLGALFSGRLVIEKFTVTGARLSLERRVDGSLNIEGLGEEESAKQGEEPGGESLSRKAATQLREEAMNQDWLTRIRELIEKYQESAAAPEEEPPVEDAGKIAARTGDTSFYWTTRASYLTRAAAPRIVIREFTFENLDVSIRDESAKDALRRVRRELESVDAETRLSSKDMDAALANFRKELDRRKPAEQAALPPVKSVSFTARELSTNPAVYRKVVELRGGVAFDTPEKAAIKFSLTLDYENPPDGVARLFSNRVSFEARNFDLMRFRSLLGMNTGALAVERGRVSLVLNAEFDGFRFRTVDGEKGGGLSLEVKDMSVSAPDGDARVLGVPAKYVAPGLNEMGGFQLRCRAYGMLTNPTIEWDRELLTRIREALTRTLKKELLGEAQAAVSARINRLEDVASGKVEAMRAELDEQMEAQFARIDRQVSGRLDAVYRRIESLPGAKAIGLERVGGAGDLALPGLKKGLGGLAGGLQKQISGTAGKARGATKTGATKTGATKTGAGETGAGEKPGGK